MHVSVLTVLTCRDLSKQMEDKALAKELDQWIACLQECKQLEESHVKILCDKVRDHKSFWYKFGLFEMYYNYVP